MVTANGEKQRDQIIHVTTCLRPIVLTVYIFDSKYLFLQIEYRVP